MISKKFDASKNLNEEDLKFFVKNGFVIYKNVFEPKEFNNIKKNILESYSNLKKIIKKKKFL